MFGICICTGRFNKRQWFFAGDPWHTKYPTMHLFIQCYFVFEQKYNFFFNSNVSVCSGIRIITKSSNNCVRTIPYVYASFFNLLPHWMICWLIYWLIYCVQRHFQQYFSYIMATSFSGQRSRNTWREPPTMGKQLVNLITCGC